MSNLKRVIEVRPAGETHQVGDGLQVRGVFSYRDDVAKLDPFLLLDYGAPFTVAPIDTPRGVGEHPHKGFETVTVVWQGEMEHRDSSGGSGSIGPGDVQWMTAGSGLVHEELYGREFARRGGTLEFAQLWVNLPARDKTAAPGYQTLPAADTPTVALPEGAGTARVIAGELLGAQGPAHTFTPVGVWDIRLTAGAHTELPIPDGHTALVFVTKGGASLNDGAADLKANELAIFDRAGTGITLAAEQETTLLVLTGEPLGEPVAAYGPFVMNTSGEIQEALRDYRAGKMGRL